MKSFSKFLLVLFLLFLFILINCYSYTSSTFQNLSSNVFRLHIIANSDSTEDQALKLEIRDNILQYLKPLTINCNNKIETIEVISNQIKSLQEIALHTINKNGYNYNVTLEIGNFNFPTKYYGNISMPAGNYDALRIKIGKAQRSELVV